MMKFIVLWYDKHNYWIGDVGKDGYLIPNSNIWNGSKRFIKSWRVLFKTLE